MAFFFVLAASSGLLAQPVSLQFCALPRATQDIASEKACERRVSHVQGLCLHHIPV